MNLKVALNFPLTVINFPHVNEQKSSSSGNLTLLRGQQKSCLEKLAASLQVHNTAGWILDSGRDPFRKNGHHAAKVSACPDIMRGGNVLWLVRILD